MDSRGKRFKVQKIFERDFSRTRVQIQTVKDRLSFAFLPVGLVLTNNSNNSTEALVPKSNSCSVTRIQKSCSPKSHTATATALSRLAQCCLPYCPSPIYLTPIEKEATMHTCTAFLVTSSHIHYHLSRCPSPCSRV
jgi:hypothetical protein